MSKGKDILMICKGHYSSKFKNTYDALRAYQAQYTGSEEKYIMDGNILTFVLDTARIYMTSSDWYWLIKEGLIHDMDVAATGMIPQAYPEREIKLSYKYLIDKIVSSLCALPVRNESGWIIDLSEYDNVENII